MELESDSPCRSRRYPGQERWPPEGAAAGSRSLGIVEQSQGKSLCWLRRDGLRGCERGDRGGKWWWRKARQPWKQGNTAESWVGGGTIPIASLPPTRQHLQLNNREFGSSNSWWGLGGALCLMHQTTEKNPRQGTLWVPEQVELRRKSGQRNLLIASYDRLEKRLW